jgi:hypothetical protein
VQRYLVDKAVILALSNAKKDEELEKDFKTSQHQKYPLAEAAGMFNDLKRILEGGKIKSRKSRKQIEEKVEGGDFTDADLELPRNSTKMTQKLAFACQSVILRDIIKAIVEFGRNPKFDLKGNSNHMLQLYIRYVYLPCIFRPGRKMQTNILLGSGIYSFYTRFARKLTFLNIIVLL